MWTALVKRSGDNLEQPVLRHLQMGMVIIGLAFWAMARMRPTEFDASLYGEFALRYPAEMWAAMIACGAAMSWVGLQHPVKRWMVMVGGVVSSTAFITLGYSAMIGGEAIIGLFCNILFGPLYVWMTMEAVINARTKRTG